MKSKFNKEVSKAIKTARKQNRDKQTDKFMEVLELRCEEINLGSIATKQAVDVHTSSI